jgi:hypothetical protein
LLLAQDSMPHRVTVSGVGGTAVLRIYDFSGLAGDRPRVGFLCRAAVSGLHAVTALNIGSGSGPPALRTNSMASCTSDCGRNCYSCEEMRG